MTAEAWLEATHGTVTVKVTLYGPVSADRYEAAVRQAERRAEQLDSFWPKPARPVPRYGWEG